MRKRREPVSHTVMRAPNGIRTRATALKGRRPGPLDDEGWWPPWRRYRRRRGREKHMGWEDRSPKRFSGGGRKGSRPGVKESRTRDRTTGRPRAVSRTARAWRRVGSPGEVAADLGPGQAQSAEGDLVPRLEPFRRPVQIEHRRLRPVRASCSAPRAVRRRPWSPRPSAGCPGGAGCSRGGGYGRPAPAGPGRPPRSRRRGCGPARCRRGCRPAAGCAARRRAGRPRCARRVAGRHHGAVRGELRVADARDAHAGDLGDLAVVEDGDVARGRSGTSACCASRGCRAPRRTGRRGWRPGSRKWFSAAEPWSMVSPVSMITLIRYCFTREAMIRQAAGVEVDVGDVQHPDGGGVRLVHRQRRGGVVELGDVGDQARQLLLVDVEFADDVAGVADHGRGRGEQPGELRLQYGLRVPRGVRGARGGGEQGERQPAGGQRAARTAVDGQSQRGRAGRPRRHRSAAPAPVRRG